MTTNMLLGGLPDGERRHMQGLLRRMPLVLRHNLELPGQQIGEVCFVDSGIVSVVAALPGDRRCEVGLIGCEGITGLSILHGIDTGAHQLIVQLAGEAQCLPAAELVRTMERMPALRTALWRYAHSFLVQVTGTALSNATGGLAERLARWLLMAHDRVEGNDIALTHEFLSVMLAVQRPGVTLALHELEGRGQIKTARGSICIVDRGGLIVTANKSYGIPEAEYRRVMDLPLAA